MMKALSIVCCVRCVRSIAAIVCLILIVLRGADCCNSDVLLVSEKSFVLARTWLILGALPARRNAEAFCLSQSIFQERERDHCFAGMYWIHRH